MKLLSQEKLFRTYDKYTMITGWDPRIEKGHYIKTRKSKSWNLYNNLLKLVKHKTHYTDVHVVNNRETGCVVHENLHSQFFCKSKFIPK